MLKNNFKSELAEEWRMDCIWPSRRRYEAKTIEQFVTRSIPRGSSFATCFAETNDYNLMTAMHCFLKDANFYSVQ